MPKFQAIKVSDPKPTDSPFYCLVCQSPLEHFSQYGEPEKPGKCPECGAKPRNRAMAYFLKTWASPQWSEQTQVLEIGASKIHSRKIIHPHFLGPAQYQVADIRKLKHHDQLLPQYGFTQTDASALPFQDKAFDHIFCNYVLQDAPKPFEIIKEISRCLKTEGWGMINVAFLADKTRPVSEIPDEEKVKTNAFDFYDINGITYQFGEDFFDKLKEYGLFSSRSTPFQFFSKKWLEKNFIKGHQEFVLISKEKAALENLLSRLSKNQNKA